MPTLDQIIAAAGKQWDLYEPATDAQRAAARAAIKNLPVELEQFYAHSDGADIGDVSIFHIDDVRSPATKVRIDGELVVLDDFTTPKRPSVSTSP